jgi:hypothetical protein
MPPRRRSEKTPVIEYLYQKLHSEGRSVATLADVQAAIVHCKKKFGLGLSSNNPANFMKDLVRGRGGSSNWPESLKALRIGGRQRVGEGRVLEFVPYAADQTEPFENSFTPSPDLKPVPIQSISLPLTAKSLGRKDESWLIQVTVGLRVIEQHLATRSREKPLDIIEITHLQIGVKLSTSEVDALFLAVAEKDGKRLNVLVVCEAKQDNERIVEHQIVGEIIAANKSVKESGLDIHLLLPIAIQAISNPPGCIYIAEFEEWTPEQAESDEASIGGLKLAAEGLYELRPVVAGVGHRPQRRHQTRAI